MTLPEIERLEHELATLKAIPTPRSRAQLDGVFARLWEDAEEIRAMLRPEIRVEVPAAIVEHIPAAEVRVNVPDQTEALAALTKVLSDLIQVIAEKETAVTVEMPELPVQLTLVEPEDSPLSLTVEFKRNPNGTIKSAKVTED